MTSPALVRSGDLKRMATIAKREGVTVWIEAPDGRKIGVSPNIPNTHRQKTDDLPDDFAL